MAKQVAFDIEARDRLRDGAGILAKAVRATLGPRGRNVVVAKSFGAPTITKDGVSVAKSIELPDHYENMGAQLLRAAASKTNDDAGDGTTTAVTLGYAILDEGLRAVVSGADPMSLKRGIDAAAEAVAVYLKEQSVPVNGRADYERVARVSANHDEEIGRLIAEAIEKVGNDGVVTIEESKSSETTVDVVEGMQFDRGFISARFATTDDGLEAVLERPFILIHQAKLSVAKDLVPILEKTSQMKRPLLIIAEDVDGEALATLVVNNMRGTIDVCAVKAPGFGDRRKEMLSDIATLTGGQVIAEELGMRLENITVGMLGQAERIVIDKETTTIIRGRGDAKDISGRVEQIKRQIEDTTSDYDREKLQERLAKLAGGVAVVNVGGHTEVEMKEKKDRCEDALSATRAAIEEGVLVGGGVALLRSQKAVDALIESHKSKSNLGDRQREDELVGMNIIRRAVAEPIRQIAENSGDEPSVVAHRVLGESGSFGYNASSRTFEDLVAAGILDPTKVVRSALMNAVSVAGILLTTEAAISDAPEDDHGHDHGHGHHHHH
ncbi:MAG: chaperonin GroEL [Candidatus Poribacteria bacterium]|nr:chaperonin GroEL [Candidatus Poribacteria bacterium]